VSERLIGVTRAALDAGIAECTVASTLGDIGAAISETAQAAGFSVLRDYAGHGIGTSMHEDPSVPNYGRRGSGMRLRSGHVLALEPMLVAGRGTSRTLADGWTVVSADGTRSAHFEHTVAVTDAGPEILTLP
jgi:methionyl aminopeptidase